MTALPLYWNLLLREIRSRYINSAGGLFWAFLLPLAQLAIYAFVFVHVLRIRIPGADLTGFVPFLAIAFWPWTAFAEGLGRGAVAITDNQALIGKVALPHAVLVLAASSAAFVLNVVGYLAVLVVLAALGTPIHFGGTLPALWILAQIFALMVGLALAFSAVQVFIRDLAHALQPLLLLWFFATPILYSLEMVPERFRFWFEINPFVHFVTGLRGALLEGAWRPDAQDWIVTAAVFAVLVAGYLFFRRLSPRFEDFL